MSFDSSNLIHLARKKFYLSGTTSPKDSRSLHRWVLLKNSVLPPQNTNTFTNAQPEVSSYSHDDREGDHETEVEQEVEQANSASTQPSAHMFEQAHDVVISGGQFYNTPGSMAIDNGLNIDAGTYSANITHLWQYHASNQVVFPSSTGGTQLTRQTERHENDDDSSHNTRSRLGENRPSKEGEDKKSTQNYVTPFSSFKGESPHPIVDRLSGLDEPEWENQFEQSIQDNEPAAFSADESLTDGVVIEILSNYPIGDPGLFNHIVKALLFSFSPLSPSMIAAFFNLNNVQDVRQILLPAYPLIFVSISRDNQEENDDQTPIRFIHSSIIEFFLDRTRSGKYFVDAQTAHRVLLERSTSVMRKVLEDGQRLDGLGRGWRDAYEYACRNWEAHRRAGMRSKL